MSEIGLFEAMYTARALRRFTADPVSDAVVERLLEAGTRAGSAGNAQPWAFVVVRDAEQRSRLGDVYRRGSEVSRVLYAARGRPAHLSDEQYRRLMSAGEYLWEHMADAPVLLMPCVRANTVPARETLPADLRARYADLLAYQQLIRGASIYPAVQNIILAARGLGLATLITTNYLYYEGEVKALLGIPEEFATCAMMPIGWPTGQFGPVTRKPLSEVAFADRWGTPFETVPTPT